MDSFPGDLSATEKETPPPIPTEDEIRWASEPAWMLLISSKRHKVKAVPCLRHEDV